MTGSSELKVREYKDLIAQLNTTIRNQNLLIESLQKDKESEKATNEELLKQVKNLTEQVEYLTRKLFGTSSEKSKDIPGQLSIFNEAEAEQDGVSDLEFPEELLAPEDEAKPARKSKRTHKETFKGIPVEKQYIDLPEDEQNCPECGTELVCIGEEFIRDELDFTPSKGKIIKIYRKKYKCPSCTDDVATPGIDSMFVATKVPAPLIPHSYASPAVVAWIMFRKFVDAVPLYRQEMDWKQLGVPLLRPTMANWMITCAKDYLKPLYDHMHRKLLEREFLMADETRVQVLKEPERKPETDSFMWLFRSGEDGLPPIILFHYTERRNRANAVEFLKGSQGYLMTDGYQGYNRMPNLKRCCCYAHIRRAFVDAVPKGKELDYATPAVQGVQFCNKLFEIERYCTNKKYTPEQRRELRDKKSRVVIDAFIKWLHNQSPVKGSRFDKAVTYALNLEAYLMTYLEDGRCSLHNNLSEIEIHPFTTGRKNWLFSVTPKGADSSAVIYSIVESAKANGLNIYEYLKYLLEQRPSKTMSEEDLEKLAPWNEDIVKRFSLSN